MSTTAENLLMSKRMSAHELEVTSVCIVTKHATTYAWKKMLDKRSLIVIPPLAFESRVPPMPRLFDARRHETRCITNTELRPSVVFLDDLVADLQGLGLTELARAIKRCPIIDCRFVEATFRQSFAPMFASVDPDLFGDVPTTVASRTPTMAVWRVCRIESRVCTLLTPSLYLQAGKWKMTK